MVILKDNQLDIVNPKVEDALADVNASNTNRHTSPNNTIYTLEPAYKLSKLIDSPSPKG
jgi:hypothetical protein